MITKGSPRTRPDNSPEKLAWFKFYITDHQSDQMLQSCSIAARGLWFELILMMRQSPRCGYLCDHKGAPLSDEIASRSARVSLRKFRSLRDELREKGVFSEDENGVMYSRKMVRDEEKRRKCSDAGKAGGGNPRLKDTFKRPFKAESESESESDPLPPKGEDRGEVVSQIRQAFKTLGVSDPAAADKTVSRTSPERALQALNWVAFQSVAGPDGRVIYPFAPEVLHSRIVTRGDLATDGWGDPDEEWSRLRTAQTEREELERQNQRSRVERIPVDELERRHGAEVDKLNMTEERRRLVRESREWQMAKDRDIRRELLVRRELAGVQV